MLKSLRIYSINEDYAAFISFLLFTSFIISAVYAPQLIAHSGAHPIRYVSNLGVNKGDCANPAFPCRTITFAVNQSGKGDKVYVASGNYTIDGQDILFLLSDMVEVMGGFAPHFKTRNSDKFVTTIAGVPSEFRDQLKQRGLRLIQDTKGELSPSEFKLSITDQKLLDTYKKITSTVESSENCTDGMAGDYPCENIDLLSHLPLSVLSSNPSSANDIWGFTNLNDNREYALLGLKNGTAIIDVTDPNAPTEIGTISGPSSTWRDVKVYQCQQGDEFKAWGYVTTEASTGGVQVIDLNNLPETVSLAATHFETSSAHNVYISNVDYSTNSAFPNVEPFLYIAGSNKDEGAYRVYSLADPENPALIAAPPTGTGYVHDLTSLLITDERTNQCAPGHNPCELLIDFNEKSVDIWDVTEKSNPFQVSSTPYDNVSYAHSGWWSTDKKYLFIQDELDERNLGLNTTLRTLDISDLSSPTVTHQWIGETQAIDHNGFTKGDRYYMSNYRAGLVVLDIADPNKIKTVGKFDTFIAPQANTPNFDGAWGAYPYLQSGNILVSDIQYGLFVLRDKTNPTVEETELHVADCDAFELVENPSTPTPTPTPPIAETPPQKSSGGGVLSFCLLIGLFGRAVIPSRNRDSL